MSHTPAPWEYVLDDDGMSSSVTFEIRMGSRLGGKNGWQPQHRIDYIVGAEQGSPDQFAEANANARLISSSPDLLEALKDMTRIARAASIGVTGNEKRISKALKSIAKAEGR